MSEFLGYVGNLHALVHVTIHLTAANSSRDPVCKLDLCCLQHVKRVQVSGEKLDITVPTQVPWDFLKFDASDTLRLEVTARRLIGSVPSFSASFRAPIGTWIAELPAELAIRQTAWGMKRECPTGSPERCNFWYSLVRCSCWCRCGACLDCLVAEGKAVRPK